MPLAGPPRAARFTRSRLVRPLLCLASTGVAGSTPQVPAGRYRSASSVPLQGGAPGGVDPPPRSCRLTVGRRQLRLPHGSGAHYRGTLGAGTDGTGRDAAGIRRHAPGSGGTLRDAALEGAASRA